ncbi:hypothetical protein FQB35_09920 [Crassaminicella thermophila]|uniref:Uncharacterized protein n=1 Tax=Crassaminicella thermophila TaxID=2599308 RepID=A0A5C0SFY1_CRATE|nr:hypothetical protein [Crassaminicella thermophila]QEK12617.1 hypothetical protein FQB35_09920 [Crassaminicella thermophila]
MKVIIHGSIKDASEILTEQIFYIIRNRVDQYAKENDLTDKEKAIIYKQFIEELKKEEQRGNER